MVAKEPEAISADDERDEGDEGEGEDDVMVLLRSAVQEGDLAEVRRLIKEEGAHVCLDVLLLAAGGGHIELWQWLRTEGGVGATVQDNCGLLPAGLFRKGTTSLHVAALFGHFPMVVWMIQHGSSINEVDDSGKTALLHAAANGHGSRDIVEWLLKHGASFPRRTRQPINTLPLQPQSIRAKMD
jgi:hypothetical protein